MQNRTPVAKAARPALPAFEPVPRKYRHDGWTPERQRAFIEALADTGSVRRAAAMVNMAQTNCYALRRAPGAEAFRRAWAAALDFGVQRLKDVAFERAMEGTLVPVFAAGKLMGFQRKHNDALLMFCLRHYAQDAGGRATTVNYFSARASAGDGSAAAEVGTATVRTVRGRTVSGRAVRRRGPAVAGDAAALTAGGVTGDPGALAALADDRLAGTLNGFGGVTLDAQAEAAINTALEACAARARTAEAALDVGGEAATDTLADDPGEHFVRVGEAANPFRGALEPGVTLEDHVPFVAGEPDWRLAGADDPRPAIAAAVARVKRAKRKPGRGKPKALPAPDADAGG